MGHNDGIAIEKGLQWQIIHFHINILILNFMVTKQDVYNKEHAVEIATVAVHYCCWYYCDTKHISLEYYLYKGFSYAYSHYCNVDEDEINSSAAPTLSMLISLTVSNGVFTCFLLVILFVPLGRTRGIVIQQLHIAEGLCRSYNDSGLYLLLLQLWQLHKLRTWLMPELMPWE